MLDIKSLIIDSLDCNLKIYYIIKQKQKTPIEFLKIIIFTRISTCNMYYILLFKKII
jgi:hypothetical protein